MTDPGGFYSYKQLVERGDVRNRTDLMRKQKLSGFPRGTRLGKSQVGFSKPPSPMHARVPAVPLLSLLSMPMPTLCNG